MSAGHRMTMMRQNNMATGAYPGWWWLNTNQVLSPCVRNASSVSSDHCCMLCMVLHDINHKKMLLRAQLIYRFTHAQNSQINSTNETRAFCLEIILTLQHLFLYKHYGWLVKSGFHCYSDSMWIAGFSSEQCQS